MMMDQKKITGQRDVLKHLQKLLKNLIRVTILTGMSRNSKAKLLAVFSTKENMRRMTEVLEELPIWQPSAKSIKSAPVITNFQKTKS